MATRDFVSPGGKVGAVEEADFQAAQAAGFRPATSEESARAKAGAQPVQAAVEGLADTATFGLSKRVQKGFAEGAGTDPNAPQLRAEENPIAHGAGEIAGFFTPGPGMVSKAGQAVAKGFASKTAGRLVGGGFEGGIYGLSSAINEDHMGDPQLTSEHVAAGTLGAALVGAGANLAFGKAHDVANSAKSALVKAFGGVALQDKLGSLAESAVMKAIASPSDMTENRLAGRADEVGRYAIDNGFTKGAPSMATAAKRASAHAQDAWKGIKNSLDVADTLGKFNPAPVATKMQGIVDEMKGNPALKSVRGKLQSFVDEMADVGSPASSGGGAEIPSTWQKRGDIYFDTSKGTFHSPPAASTATAAVEGSAPTSFRKAYETLSSVLDEVGEKDPTKGTESALFRMRKEMQDELFSQVSALDPKLGETLQESNRAYANAATFRNLAGKRASAGFSDTDYLAGAAAFAHSGPAGLVVPLAKRALRERGGFIAASALDALAESGALPKIAKGFQLVMNSRLANPGFGGPFRATLETAAAQGSMALLQTHLQLAQSDPGYMAAIGLEHEDPSVVSDYADKAHRLASLSSAVDSSGAAIDRSIGRVLGEQPGRAPEYVSAAPTLEQFNDLKAKLKILASDDGSSRRKFSELAPTTAGLTQMQVVQAANYLLNSAPKNPSEGLPEALQRPWAPGKGDLRGWLKRVATVADPHSVLASMQANAVSSEQLETLQAVYPRILQEFKDKMTSRLAEWKEPLDRKRRGQVAQLIGNIDDPAVTQLIQAAHMQSTPAKASKPDGRESVDVQKNEQTQAQRLEGH